jgi:hypothetical protein
MMILPLVSVASKQNLLKEEAPTTFLYLGLAKQYAEQAE